MAAYTYKRSILASPEAIFAGERNGTMLTTKDESLSMLVQGPRNGFVLKQLFVVADIVLAGGCVVTMKVDGVVVAIWQVSNVHPLLEIEFSPLVLVQQGKTLLIEVAGAGVYSIMANGWDF